MNPRIRKLVALFVLLALAVVAVTVGFGAANFWTFGGQRSDEIAPGLFVTTWVDPQIRSVHVLGVNLYSWNRPPYSLKLLFSSRDRTVETMILERVILDFGSERQIMLDMTDNEKLSLQEHQYSNWTSDGLVRETVWRCVTSLANTIPANKSFTLRCRCRGGFSDGKELVFEFQRQFDPENKSGLHRGWLFYEPVNPPQ